MPSSNPDATVDISVLTSAPAASSAPTSVEREVLLLFDGCAPSLLRYVGSFGLSREETEDIVQELFLALFRHIRLNRPRGNLKGWLFQAAHNLALKQRKRSQRQPVVSWDEAASTQWIDPGPNPEMRLAASERRRRLLAVFSALPERDRQCLSLRAEGLRYRDIAGALGVSLGAVAKSLARGIARLVRADQG